MQHLHVVARSWQLVSHIAKLPNEAFVLSSMADSCSMVNLVCLFMKMHLLSLLQDNCLDMFRCAFLHKLSGCVRNISVLSKLLHQLFWPMLIYR